MDLNLDPLDAATLRLIDRESISLVLVGCGGRRLSAPPGC